MAQTAPSELRILCFGASITAGYYAFGLHSHPYAIQLYTRLQASLPDTKLTIDVDGLSGDRVIGGQYFSRLATRSPPHAPVVYDWIIIQAGGNDLGWGFQPPRIFEELKRLWAVARSAKMKVMALTVTETAEGSWNEKTRAKYEALNRMVLDSEDREEGIWVGDVCAKVPYASMDEEMRKKVWDDGLHLKPKGYDMMGDAIAERLIEILREGASSKTGDGKEAKL